MKTAVFIAALLVTAVFWGTGTNSSRADASQTALTLDLPAQVQDALRDAQKGKFDAVNKIHDEYGDAALKYFVAARFDPDVNVRKAALYAAHDDGTPGFTETSLFFLIPMLDDPDADIAISVAGSIKDLRRSPKVFQRLEVAQLVRLVKNAAARNPKFIRHVPAVLILIARFKQTAAARGLVNHLVKANNWDTSTAAANSVKWDMTLIDALVARCEIGDITTAQVIKVLTTNPKLRSLFLNTVNLITDETLLRYAISLLYDTTLISPGNSDDVPEARVCRDARISFRWATGVELRTTNENSAPDYDAKAIQKLYKFYGLKR